jgi:hypothetical protein
MNFRKDTMFSKRLKSVTFAALAMAVSAMAMFASAPAAAAGHSAHAVVTTHASPSIAAAVPTHASAHVAHVGKVHASKPVKTGSHLASTHRGAPTVASHLATSNAKPVMVASKPK